MALPYLRAVSGLSGPCRGLVMVSLIALSTAGCLAKSKAEFTAAFASLREGSSTEAPTQEQWRQSAEAWGRHVEANPSDPQGAIYYARALRATDQRAQAVAVLQQAAIRSPKNLQLLAAYGKALADVGRYKEADEVLGRAHTPERPDWGILSAQGAVADQVGDHALAQRYYEAALKIAPGEPSVLSNLGLSYALSKRLPEAEKTLREADAHPKADARVRQNLALICALQGKFQDAEGVLQRDLPAGEVSAALATLRQMVAQPNSWAAIRAAEGKTAHAAAQPKTPAPSKAAAQPKTPAKPKTAAQEPKLELRRF
jgi:Flp pilus assembly protein TadD